MLTNKELGEYLENVRKQKDLTLRQVDYKADVSFSHLSMIEKGTRKASPFILKQLSKVYNIDYIDLLEKAGYIDLAQKEKIEENNSLFGSKLLSIPILGRVPAGEPLLASENIEGYLPIDPSMYGITNPNDFFFLRVAGESMNKLVKNGSYVLIRKQDYAEDNDVVVAIVNGDEEATLKRFKELGNGFIALKPESTFDEYIDRIINLKDTNFKILGKVIGDFKKW